MRLAAIILSALTVLSSQAHAQEEISGGSSIDMARLVAQGFEIKASGQSGTRLVVFLQKDKSAYACEFVSVTKTRCGAIK